MRPAPALPRMPQYLRLKGICLLLSVERVHCRVVGVFCAIYSVRECLQRFCTAGQLQPDDGQHCNGCDWTVSTVQESRARHRRKADAARVGSLTAFCERHRCCAVGKVTVQAFVLRKVAVRKPRQAKCLPVLPSLRRKEFPIAQSACSRDVQLFYKY